MGNTSIIETSSHSHSSSSSSSSQMLSEQDKLIGAFKAFYSTVKTLRAPDGCPWDQKQTHQSLIKYLIEESAECADALESHDFYAINDELGDVLLQVFLHAAIGEEKSDNHPEHFSLESILTSINAKMIRRHPHVFDKENYPNDEASIIQTWQDIKVQEKAMLRARGQLPAESSLSKMDEVPKHLPSLIQAQELSKEAAKYGFDWNNVADVRNKLIEELNEFEEATKIIENKAHQTEELGDILFVLTNYARHLDIDANEALKGANKKFRTRFKGMETLCKNKNIQFESLDLKQQETLWQEVKHEQQQNRK